MTSTRRSVSWELAQALLVLVDVDLAAGVALGDATGS